MSEIIQSSSRPLSAQGRQALWCALALTVLHFLWVGAHLAPAIMSPDANGYVVQARLIADLGRTSLAPASPAQYVGMHWLETADGVFHSRYPAGLPLLFAAVWNFGGLAAALFINPLLASATVLLTFLLARRFASGGYAWLAAAVVATVSITNQHALDADAHVAAAFFLVAGISALLRFGDKGGVGAGLVAGLLLGSVPAIRYPEAIAGIAIAAWLGWRVRPVWRAWPAVLGALVPIVALGIHNTAAYGAFWRTGYALTNEQTGFGLGYFFSHAIPYLQGMAGQGLALMFAFGVAGLAALTVDVRHRREGALFAGLVVPIVLLYMAYYFGGPGPGGAGGNLRFLIPTFPFLAIAGVWLLAQMAEHLGPAGRVAALTVAGLQLLIGIGTSGPTLVGTRRSLQSMARVQTQVGREIPAGSVLIVDRQLAESFDAVGSWRLVEEGLLAGSGPLGALGPGLPGGRPPGPGAGGRGEFRPMVGGPEGRGLELAEDDPSPMQRGKNRAQQERYAGLAPAERQQRVWTDVRTWAGDQPVYWLTRSLEAVETALPEGASYRTVAEIEAPSAQGPGGGGAPGGGRAFAGPLGRVGRAGPGRPLVGAGGAGAGGPGPGFFPPGGLDPRGRAGPMMRGAGLPGGLRGANLAGGAMRLRLVRIEWPNR